ncbi:MAG: DNA methyltransferase [Candidatus Promineifilaceae bacterium]
MTTVHSNASHQLILPFEQPTLNGKVNGSSSFNDPAFASNKRQPVHRWVPWIAGYSFDFVRDAINKYGNGHTVVLDPFAGVGTTLLEANLHGYDAIGFEINPYPAMASQVKTTAHKVDVQSLEVGITRFNNYYQEKVISNYTPESVPPSGFKTRSPFYSQKVLRKVLILHDFINQLIDDPVKNLFKLAFASTMVTYSNYSYEPSLGRRTSAGKDEIDDYPVGELIFQKLLSMLEDIIWLKQQQQVLKTQTQIINDSFFNYREHLIPETTDLVITSPPYLNNYHYNRNTRSHLYWLDFANAPKDLEPLEQANFGKYWQTVRELEKIELDFVLPTTDIEEHLELLREQKKDKGIYGGNGWANYAASYFNDCYRLASGISYALRQNGIALVVIGNSILQGIMFPTDEYFAQIAELAGLKIEQIDVPRSTRVGNSIIQSSVRSVQAKNKHSLYESIVVLRKA